MIKAILVFNNHGKPRLSKFYQYYGCLEFVKSKEVSESNELDFTNSRLLDSLTSLDFTNSRHRNGPEETQQQIIRETFHLVSRRDDNVCSFLEGGTLIGGSDYKLIYRHYATLYFVFCVDSSESELGILDLIQVLVETLDRCFENVCELDLIFHVDKVHYILSEIVMGGMVLETNMAEVTARYLEQDKLEKSEAGISAAPAKAAAVIKSIDLPTLPKDLKLPNIELPKLPSFRS